MQSTVETSTYGSEFIALRTATDLVSSMIYKIRMFGIHLDGPAQMFCDNESVVKNGSYPDSPLKNRHISIAYH